MPRGNPRSSFEAAVRHLFRHLEEPRELRRNPLVSAFFESGDSSLAQQCEADVHGQIRRLVDVAAERCILTPGSDERRRRQVAIVTKSLRERKPANAVAAELGISKSLLYLERAEICKRIAGYIEVQALLRRKPPAEPRSTSFRFRHAVAQFEAGEYDRAIHTYDRILSDSADAAVKVESLCRRAEVQLECGRFSEAWHSLQEARNATETRARDFATESLAAARAHADFLESRHAWVTADFPTAENALCSARRMLEDIGAAGGGRIKELFLEVLSEYGNRARLDGEFAEAAKYLERIRGIVREIPDMEPLRTIDLTVLQARIRYLSARAGARFHGGEPATLLKEALSLARACGSLRRILEPEIELIGLPQRGDEGIESPLETAQRILSMATELGNPRLMSFSSIYAADRLIGTNHWHAVPAILRVARQFEPEGGREWAHMLGLESDYYERAGRFIESLRCAEKALRAARAMGSPRVEAAALRSMAKAEMRLGHRAKAGEYITSSLSLVERSGSPNSCINSYRAAAEITGDRRYAAAAAELHRAIG